MKKDRRLRTLWSSNAPFAKSGYSNQTKDIVYRLLDDGWPIAVSCFYGLEGGTVELNGLRCYPKLASTYGEDACIMHGKHWKADIVINFQDQWTMDPNKLSKINRYVPYMPVDHDPVPPAILDRIKQAYRIISYSDFGYRKLKEAGFNSTMIPHGVDTDIFMRKKKKDAREKYGIPQDLFLFGMVSANKDNPPRKEFQRVLDAFKVFHQDHPKSAIFFHTIMDYPNGFPIGDYANYLGLSNQIYFMQPYQIVVEMAQSDIADLYNAFDVLLCPSSHEGFGLPIIEAQACETPVIVTDFSAMSELVTPETGWKTKVGYKRYTPLKAYVGHPDEKDLYQNMEASFKADRKAMGKAGRVQMVEKYAINKIVKSKWIPWLEEVQKDIYKE